MRRFGLAPNGPPPYPVRPAAAPGRVPRQPPDRAMKVVSSIGSAKFRHPDCKVVRRKGRIYVINKTDPRFKARQGGAKNKKKR